MMHLQARRNLEVFLHRTGIRQFTAEEAMSFRYPDHRLDLVFRAGVLQMTVSVAVEAVNDAACLSLMTDAGHWRPGPLLRVYRLPGELGINGVLADTEGAEQWFRLYTTQKNLLLNCMNQTPCHF